MHDLSDLLVVNEILTAFVRFDNELGFVKLKPIKECSIGSYYWNSSDLDLDLECLIRHPNLVYSGRI